MLTVAGALVAALLDPPEPEPELVDEPELPESVELESEPLPDDVVLPSVALEVLALLELVVELLEPAAVPVVVVTGAAAVFRDRAGS